RLSQALIAASTLVVFETDGLFIVAEISSERLFHGARLVVLRQRFFNPSFVEILVQLVVNHHGRSVVARSQANNRQQRESTVYRCSYKRRGQSCTEVVTNFDATHQPAGDAVADECHVLSDRFAMNEVVERRDTVEVGNGDAKQFGEIAEAFIGDPSPVALHGE